MMEDIVKFLGGTESTIAFAIFCGVTGFFAKVSYELFLARRKDRLDRINKQLCHLYGPLFSINQASYLAWMAFRTECRPGKPFFGTEPPPTADELAAWRTWMINVFQPNNEKMLSIINENSHLLVGNDFPLPLQMFCAHVSSYRAVLAKWSEGDFSVNVALLNYPTEELGEYLQVSFQTLKEKQSSLLGAQS